MPASLGNPTGVVVVVSRGAATASFALPFPSPPPSSPAAAGEPPISARKHDSDSMKDRRWRSYHQLMGGSGGGGGGSSSGSGTASLGRLLGVSYAVDACAEAAASQWDAAAAKLAAEALMRRYGVASEHTTLLLLHEAVQFVDNDLRCPPPVSTTVALLN
eukprot:COSAG01_NODE_10657_length_2111_cov_1.978131_3_plen_160_part_00